jgi:uncharacterized membrane protein
MAHAIAYVVALVVFVVVDMVWLGVVAKGFYRDALGGLLAEQFNIPAAIAFYLINTLGLMIFVVGPALRSGSLADAALYGVLFGFFCYATYDLTNLATLRSWPLTLSLVDMAWGAVLTGITATAAVAVAARF